MALKLFFFAITIAAANAGLALTSTSDNTYRSHGNLAQISTQSKSIDTPYSSSSKTDIRVSNPGVYASPAPVAHYVSSAPTVQHYSSAPALQHYSSAPAVQHYSSAPVVQHYSSAPAVQHYAQATVAHNAPVYTSAPGPVLSKTAYAVSAPAPAVHYAQHAHVAQPLYAHAAPAVSYAHAAPVSYSHAAPEVSYAHAAPTVSYAHAAPVSYAHAAPVSYSHGSQVAAHQPLLGVAYSPASSVAHLSYNNINDHVNYAW